MPENWRSFFLGKKLPANDLTCMKKNKHKTTIKCEIEI